MVHEEASKSPNSKLRPTSPLFCGALSCFASKTVQEPPPKMSSGMLTETNPESTAASVADPPCSTDTPVPNTDSSQGPPEELEVTQSHSISSNMPADVKLTLAMFAKAIQNLGTELIVLANEWQDGLYERSYKYANMGGRPTSKHPILPKHVVSLPKMEAFDSTKIGRVVTRAHIFIRSQMPLLARLDEDPSTAFKDVGYDVFKAFFGDTDLFPMPRGVLSEESEFWKNDDAFADQFLNGCNPTVIERPHTMEQVSGRMPKELLEVVAPSPDGRSVTQLFQDNDLFWADYSVLLAPKLASGYDEESGAFTNEIRFDAVSKALPMTKYFYAPFVALYKRKDGRLGVLGIVLTRNPDAENAVYNQDTCQNTPNIYTFAKMHVACADNQVHQFYSHLGRCHLAFEPFGVAVRNVFQFGDEAARNHIVGKLLSPHFTDHMAINWLARNTLIAHGDDAIAFTDAGFALGTRGGVTLLAAKYSRWRLQDQAFPAQLKLRGFDPEAKDGLDNYYYRSDGMRIWNALSRYVKTALKSFYSSDTAESRDAMISGDEILAAWCTEMRDPERAFVPSFPAEFRSLDELCETVTTIMYNVSAEHAAVNASQERYLSYVPNRPNALFRPVPQPGGDEDMHLIREVLGIHRMGDNELGASLPLAFAMFQVQFSQLLTLPPTKTLMELDEVKTECAEAHHGLMEDLEKAHYLIKARNIKIEEETPHLAPYEFLDPAQIALSIEI